MKKVKVLALLVILVAVVASGSPGAWMPTGVLCGSSNDPSLCPDGVDAGCTDFCLTACDGFQNVTGTCVLVDGSIKLLSPSGMAILRALAQRPGDVVTRSELLRVLPGNGNDTHAVDTAVLRLRTALGDKNILATVVKRGYRLAIDSPAGAA